jgi:hypothetical protein
MRLKVLPTLIALLLFSKICSSQITVTYPSNRIVLQRDNANQASVTIAGYFQGCADRIEARFVPRAAGQGTPAPAGGGWAVIQNNPGAGNFYGSMPVSGGWYKLEVRSVTDNAEIAVTTVERVGVGEVFVVTGQSNATGGDGKPNGPGATDDRVNSVNFQNYNPDNSPAIAPYSAIQLPCQEFVHLDDVTKTAPFGNYAWCWGAFGDNLVNKLQVPVMIFNAGWSSTSVRNWKESIPVNAVTTSDFSFQFPAGLPFGHLRIAVNNYIARLGVRAVLWHLGETDNLVSTTREAYLSDIRQVIRSSREVSGKDNLAWVIARASRNVVNGTLRTWPPIIDAQNDVIGIGSHGSDLNYKLPGVFAGPETDPYFGPIYRDEDQIHFTGNGLLSLAGWWSEKLNTDFFANSAPYASIPPPKVSVSRTETAEVNFNGPSGWNSYGWLTAGNCNNILSGTQSVNFSSGDYQLKTTDSFNNVLYSPMLRVPGASSPTLIAANSDVSQQVIKSNVNNLLINDCRILGRISPAVNSTVINQALTARTYIDATVQTYNNAPYVQRHFDIKTDPGNTNLASRLTLFYTQAEFDRFNALSATDIPKTPDDQSGKNNVRVIQFTGTSGNNSGAAGSYNGTRTEITPGSVAWNTNLNSWEISFDVSNSGGFFLGTANAPLPVTLKYFKGNTSGKSAALSWETSAEVNASYFDLERSRDAIHFEALTRQSAAGYSKVDKQYTYQDFSLANGIYYYRLKQVDQDNSFEYSRTISLEINDKVLVRAFPNPVRDHLTIQSEIEINSVEIINELGIVLQSLRVKTNTANLDMTQFPAGLYVIRVNKETFKIIKQ